MNPLAQQHNLPIAPQMRDFILVITRSGDLITLRIRDIISIQPTHELGRTAVHHLSQKRDGPAQEVTVIQEPASVFWNRCLLLLEALRHQDGEAINQSFAPRIR